MIPIKDAIKLPCEQHVNSRPTRKEGMVLPGDIAPVPKIKSHKDVEEARKERKYRELMAATAVKHRDSGDEKTKSE